jgi:hypothetical protein
MPGMRNMVKVVVQGGIGFVGASIDDTDSGVSELARSGTFRMGNLR